MPDDMARPVQRDGSERGLERPDLPAMGHTPEGAGAPVQKDRRDPGVMAIDNSSLPDRPEVDQTGRLGTGDQVPAEPGGQHAKRPGPSYLRLRLHVENGETSISDASRVEGPLVTADEPGGAFAYEVTVNGRRVSGDALGDLGTWRSFPSPDPADSEQRGHHEYETGRYEFTARIPADRLPPVDALGLVEVVLFKVTDSSRSLHPVGEQSLLDRYPVELREVSRIGGDRLSGELQRLVQR